MKDLTQASPQEPTDTNLSYGLDIKPIKVADSLILKIAKQSLAEVEGFHSLSPRLYDEVMDGITNKFGQHKLPGINIKHRKDGIEINLYVKALFGYNVIAMAQAMQRQIRQDLKNRLDLNAVKVDVHIEGIIDQEIQLPVKELIDEE